MIYSIKGCVTEKLNGAVAIENSGIAYLVNVPDNSYAYLAQQNEEIKLFTAMIVREDDISLYGFTDKISLAMFKILMTVSGVGAKAALAILSVGSAAAVKSAIVFEDVDFIQQANGIGKKTAQRIVLELKDKIEKSPELAEITAESSVKEKSADDKKMQALDALITLGYTKAEASAALTGVKADSVEAYISMALRNR